MPIKLKCTARADGAEPISKGDPISHEDEGRPGGPDFPCASLDEALKYLRRPPTAEAVRFKIQAVAGEVAQVAPYVDARLVFDRLDLVCAGRWLAAFEQLPEPLRSRPCDRNGERLVPPIDVRCLLTLFGLTRQDVGQGDDPSLPSPTRSSGRRSTSGSAGRCTRSGHRG